MSAGEITAVGANIAEKGTAADMLRGPFRGQESAQEDWGVREWKRQTSL